MKTEAVDTYEVPQFFHQSKIDEIEKDNPAVEGLLPDLGNHPETQKYLEYITSKSYESVLQKVQHYSGKDPKTLDWNSVVGSVMSSIQTVISYEKNNEEKLTELALNLVLSLPEFKLAKLEKEAGTLEFDLKLGEGTPSLKDANEQIEDSKEQLEEDDVPDENNPEELTKTEQLDQEIAESYSDEVNRRALARVIFQGNAINKFYTFNLMEEELSDIHPRLPKLYGIACSYIHLLYYAVPNMDLDYESADASGAAQGSCQVLVEEDKTVIKAAGVMFPYLVHEIVKCLFEYFTLADTGTKEILDNQQLQDEIVEMLSGPEAYKIFIKNIDYDNHDTIPLVFQRFLRLPADDIKNVMAGNNAGKSIIDKLVNQARIDIDKYEKELEDYNSSQ